MPAQVGELLSEVATPADVETILGATPDQVADAMHKLEQVLARVESAPE